MASPGCGDGTKHLRGDLGFGIDGVKLNAIYLSGAMTKIFISYRRQDSKPIATLIYRPLAQKFGAGDVFLDVYGIPKGLDFHDYLNEQVSKAEVLLAIIADRWLTAADEHGRRRLDDKDDFVRIEIDAALKRGIPVIPLYVDGARPVRSEDLPVSLKSLARRNGAFLDTGVDFDAHIARLIQDIEPHLNGAPRPADVEAARRHAEGRIEIDAVIVSNPHGRWFLPGAGKTEWFKDFDTGPEMVVVPAGSFMMGSPEDEPGHFSDESPQHNVTISHPFAIGRHAVTRGQFAAFVSATGHKTDGGARVWNGKELTLDPAKSWRDPGFAQDDRHSVVCVNWEDAQAYVTWLNRKTGKTYQLPSEAEWEYACRAGTRTPFWWGPSITPNQANYNGAAHVYEGGGRKGEWRRKTVPADSFATNPWGLYQVHGNVWEWTADCWNWTYEGAPTDSSARIAADGDPRVLRGGSWSNGPWYLRAACRLKYFPDGRGINTGFRLCRTLYP